MSIERRKQHDRRSPQGGAAFALADGDYVNVTVTSVSHNTVITNTVTISLNEFCEKAAFFIKLRRGELRDGITDVLPPAEE